MCQEIDCAKSLKLCIYSFYLEAPGRVASRAGGDNLHKGERDMCVNNLVLSFVDTVRRGRNRVIFTISGSIYNLHTK